jgi:capsular exopolysaccharide synthesis family protein
MKTIEIIRNEQDNYFIREAFNTLRTNVLFSGKDVKTIIVTSCFAHEGKTTVSFNLCTSLAEAGKRVLLVDADLRKSAFITRYTKEKGVVGLSQVLSGQVDLSNAIYPTSVKGLDVIFTGPFPPNPTELVGSPAFRELLASQRPIYDYIIIDAPPLGLVIDAAVMGSFCDGAVLVVNTGTVKRRVALDVKAQLEKSGTRLIGVVLNQVQKKSGRAAITGSQRYQHYYSYEHSAPESASTNFAATSNSSAASNNSTTIRRPSAPTAGARRPAASTPSTPVRRTPTAPDGRPMQAGVPTRPTAPTTPTTPTRPVGRVPSSPVRRPEEPKNDD